MTAPPLMLRSRALVRKVSASLRDSISKISTGLEMPPVVRPVRRTSSIHRLPLISAALLSSLPLHSAIASCRLQSILSAESQSWGLIPQENLELRVSIPMALDQRYRQLDAFMTGME